MVSAIAARAWMPRACSVHTAVRTSVSSPPKNSAVPVTSTCTHSGRPADSTATRGANRRHQRATSSIPSRSATGSSATISARWQARGPSLCASTASASASDIPATIRAAGRPRSAGRDREREAPDSPGAGTAHAQATTRITPRGSWRQTKSGACRSSGLSRSLRCTGHRGSQIVMMRGIRPSLPAARLPAAAMIAAPRRALAAPRRGPGLDRARCRPTSASRKRRSDRLSVLLPSRAPETRTRASAHDDSRCAACGLTNSPTAPPALAANCQRRIAVGWTRWGHASTAATPAQRRA